MYMKVYLITFSFFIYSFSFFSQFWITSVSSSPFPANDCDNLSITINGNYKEAKSNLISSLTCFKSDNNNSIVRANNDLKNLHNDFHLFVLKHQIFLFPQERALFFHCSNKYIY